MWFEGCALLVAGCVLFSGGLSLEVAAMVLVGLALWFAGCTALLSGAP